MMEFRNKVRVGLGGLVLVGLSACGGSAEDQAGGAGFISSTVLDDATENPIAGAEITVLDLQDGAVLARAQSDGDGAFTLENLPKNELILLRAAAPNYMAQATVTFSEGAREEGLLLISSAALQQELFDPLGLSPREGHGIVEVEFENFNTQAGLTATIVPSSDAVAVLDANERFIAGDVLSESNAEPILRFVNVPVGTATVSVTLPCAFNPFPDFDGGFVVPADTITCISVTCDPQE